MAKKRSMVNNNLGGNQIVYVDGKETEPKDTIETYNVSANEIEVDKLVQTVYDEFNNSEERKLMLDGMFSAAAVGLYSIAHSITGVVSIITQAINSSLIPYTFYLYLN